MHYGMTVFFWILAELPPVLSVQVEEEKQTWG